MTNFKSFRPDWNSSNQGIKIDTNLSPLSRIAASHLNKQLTITNVKQTNDTR